jgi:hypothetical protein
MTMIRKFSQNLLFMKYIPMVQPDELEMVEYVSSPIFTMVVHTLIFAACFVIGYSWKPIVGTESFSLLKDQVVQNG